MDFYHLRYIFQKQLLDTGLDALKTTSKNAFHKATKATSKFKRNQIADKILKREEILNEWQVL